jgi:hypothetical protein
MTNDLSALIAGDCLLLLLRQKTTEAKGKAKEIQKQMQTHVTHEFERDSNHIR